MIRSVWTRNITRIRIAWRYFIQEDTGLTTSLGRWLEHITYKTMAWRMLQVIIGFALFYWIFSLAEWSATHCREFSFFDSVYFSVVTFASLGYGDMLPVGFGKFLAVTEVLWGLALVALFVGKIASERQAAQILLLYTSEQQRRLREFSDSINEVNEALKQQTARHDYQSVHQIANKAVRIVASTASYLSFQAQQGGLADYGNIPAIRAVYRAVADIQLTAITILKIKELPGKYRNNLKQLNERAVSIHTGMHKYHPFEEKSLALLNLINRQDKLVKKWLADAHAGKTQWNHNTTLSEAFLEKIYNSLPPHPWPKDIHKITAAQFHITNKFAQKCIEELIARNKWPDHAKD